MQKYSFCEIVSMRFMFYILIFNDIVPQINYFLIIDENSFSNMLDLNKELFYYILIHEKTRKTLFTFIYFFINTLCETWSWNLFFFFIENVI